VSDRIMYDSTNMPAIPADAQIVAGYPHAFSTDYARFPHALQVRIDQHGNHPDDCHVADVENGAIAVSAIRLWVSSWHVHNPQGLAAVNGHFARPTVYCNESTLPAVRAQLVGALYDVWVAAWGTGPTVIAGTSAHQYADPPASGGDYDVSVVYDTAWGVAGSPPPAPGPTPPPSNWQENMMRALPTVKQGATGPDVRSVQGLCGARGHPTAVDGVFGPSTDGAVRSVQAEAGVTVDGIVGPVTWQKLMAV